MKPFSCGNAVPFFVFALLLFRAVPVPAQAVPVAAVPVDEQKTYRAAVAAFEAVTLTEDQEYLKTSIPQLLFERLSDIPSHRLSETEITRYRERLLRTAVVNAGKELASIILQRDQLIFSENTQSKIETDRTIYDEKIAAQREKLAELQAMEASKIEVAAEKPLVFFTGTDQLLLNVSSKASPELMKSLSEKDKLDMIIYGSLEEIQGYLYIEVFVYSALSGKNLSVVQDAVATDNAFSVVDSLSEEVAQSVVGRPWGTLIINPVPITAEVYMNGMLAGVGQTTVKYLEPGEKTIVVRAEGYREESRTLELAVNKTETLSVELSEQPKRSLTITSRPIGADMYIGALWVGKTPATVEPPEGYSPASAETSGIPGFSVCASAHNA